MSQIIPWYTPSHTYHFDLSEALDISLPLRAGSGNVNCYYAEEVDIKTIRTADFVGSVAEGGSVNYQKVSLTPHGNGTHTECFGHISADPEGLLPLCLQNFLFLAELVSLEPTSGEESDDLRISKESLLERYSGHAVDAMIIRTQPNDEAKKTRKYSGTNPPYLEPNLCHFLVEKGVQHLLVDLPSVDKEEDGGKLLAHRAFWQYPEATRKKSTITELIYVDNQIADGLYLLNLQTTHLYSDASPSRPVLYRMAVPEAENH